MCENSWAGGVHYVSSPAALAGCWSMVQHSFLVENLGGDELRTWDMNLQDFPSYSWKMKIMSGFCRRDREGGAEEERGKQRSMELHAL